MTKPGLTLFEWFEPFDYQAVGRLDGYRKLAHYRAEAVPQRAKSAPLLCRKTVNSVASSSTSPRRASLHERLFLWDLYI